MKVVILAGGFGTRISEESSVRPKPMVEIGGYPILWHIMKYYSHFNLTDFIVCLGYKGYVIKEYFSNYFLYRSDVTFDLKNNRMDVHQNGVEPWRVTLIETGEKTMTGGRLKKIRDYIGDQTFCLTYGDGLCTVDLKELIEFHKEQGVLATLTASQPEGRYGVFTLSDSQTLVRQFREKPKGDGSWINGGYFVLEPGVMDYIRDDTTIWELEPMQKLAHDGQLSAFKHYGFWHGMDSLRDKMHLEEIWNSGKAPWKVWK
jgi:glucose-1-phosphate cytidylyltransferase